MKRIPLPDFVNRISLSAMRKHGVARYIVAVLVTAVALAGAAFGAYALTVEPLTLISSDGYALPNDDAADALADLAASGKGAKDIDPVQFKAGDALWSGFGGLSVGEDRTPISASFPLFINDGAAVQMPTGEGTLVTRTYDELDAYPGMIVSEGQTYTETGEAADADTYRFLKVHGGVYVVLQSMRLSAQGLDEMLPTGSIVVLTESAVACFRLDNGVYTASRMTVFPQATYVSFGPEHEDEQTYDALLRGLGLLSDPAQPKPEPEPEEEPEEFKGGDKEEQKAVEAQPEGGPVTEAPAAEGDGDGEGEPGEWGWSKPEASANAFTPSVYQASTTLTINDPAGVLSRPVRFEFRRGGQLYLRASFSAGGEVTVQGLEPNTSYDVTGFITYRNRAGQEAEEEFFSQSITTGDPSSLEPMRISFSQGELFPERLQFNDIAFAGGSAELLANASGLSFEVDGRSFALSSELRTAMLKGEKVPFTTSASFEPGATYDVTLAATDRSGNVLPLRAAALSARTCKDKPKARLHMVKNESSNLVIGVDLVDDFNAVSGNATLDLYDDAGTLIESKELKVGAHEYAFGDLGYSRLLHAKVTCDYDLGDGKGLHEGEVVGTMDFTTVSISVLGYAVYATTVSDVADTSATLNVSLNTNQMDARLVALLTHGSVSAGVEGKDPVFTHAFTSDEMDALRRGEKLEFRMTGFDSMTTYKISTTAGAQIGDEETGIYNKVNCTNRVDSFKTLRHPAVAEFKNTVVMANEILFDARVLDIDKAVNKDVMLEVRDRFGRLMGEQLRFDPVGSPDADGWQECVFKDLEQDQTYTVNVVAYDYNQGFDNGTLKARTVLYTGEIVTTNGVSGTITLHGVDEAKGDSGKLDVRARVEIADLWNELNPHQFTIEVLRDDKVIDSYAVPFTGTSDTIDLEPYRIDRSDATYKMRLLVHHHQGKRVELSEVEFSGAHGLIGIADEADLKTLPKNDLDGHFIVLDDIATTAIDVAATDSVRRFEGSIDFQGYTITLNRTDPTPDKPQRRGLIEYLGEHGVLKNVNLVVNGTPYGALAEQCYGTISNVKVTIKSPGSTDVKVRQSMGGIAMGVGATGLVENFAVNLGGDHLVSSNSGGVVAGCNNGVIRNGYVYGGRLVVPNGMPSDSTFQQIGGVVGWAYANSRLSNLISMVDIVAPTDCKSQAFGLIVGQRSGCQVSGLLATGTLVNYYAPADNSAYKYGPVVGSAASGITARNKNIYYLGEMPTGVTTDGSASVSPLALYDRAWYEEYLDPQGALDLSPVLRECFPQVKFPSVMGAQDYLPLPEKPEVYEPTITSLRVLENKDAEATVQVSFSNPDHYEITQIDVAGALSQVAKQEVDVDDSTLTRVTLHMNVGEAQQYLSKYSIVGMTYELYDGKPIHVDYQAGECDIAVEFWRSISSVEDWVKMSNSSENFRLNADLDFTGRKYKDFYIANFYGKLDGQGHTVSNIATTEVNAVFVNLRNALMKNLRVDSLSIDKRLYGAFIQDINTGCTIDNVHISNAKISVYERSGVLAAGVGGSSVIMNCSVTDSVQTVLEHRNWHNLYVGGLVSTLNNATITNCYVQNAVVDADAADTHGGIGGVVGHMANTATVSQCYATGAITASHDKIGGIVGITTYGSDRIESVWSDVDILTSSNQIGGLVGRVEGATYQPMTSLSLGNVYSSGIGLGEVGHIYGSLKNTTTVISGAYYFDGQVVGGLSHDDGSPLSYGQLCQPVTYSDQIGLNGFDLSQVSEGILPKLLDTEGDLMPGQDDHYIVEPDSLKLTGLVAEHNAGAYQVKLEIDHASGDIITGATFDALDPNGKVDILPSGSGTHTTVVYHNLKPLRAYDTYRLESIEYERNGGERSQLIGERVYFGAPVYKTIASIEDWKKIDRDSFENYKVTGDLDFTGLDYVEGNFGVKVNRLEGEGSPVIKNIDVTFKTKETGCSLVDIVRSSVRNLTFESISMHTDGAQEPVFGPSLICQMIGSGTDGASGLKNGAHNLKMKDVALAAAPVGNGSRTSGYMGMIALLDGDVSDVTVERVEISTTSTFDNSGGGYYGAVFGFGTPLSTVSNVTASNVAVHVMGTSAGGVGGKLEGSANNIAVSDVQVSSQHSGTDSIGGAFGYCARVDTVSVTGTRTDADSVASSTSMVAGRGANVGGIVGEGHVQDATAKGLVVRGNSFVGGMNGRGSINNWMPAGYDESTVSVVDGCQIEGVETKGTKSDRIGGAFGYSDSDSKNLLVTNTVIKGHSRVGGFAGSNNGAKNYIVVEGCTVSATGDYAGGLVGYGGIWNGGVSDTTVNGGRWVGGMCGWANQCGYSYVDRVTVSGNDLVGGLAGELNLRGNTGGIVSVNATVMAKTGAAGGVVGIMGPEYNAATSNAAHFEAIFTGSVTGKTYAGGIFGEVQSGIVAANTRGFMVAGSIEGGLSEGVVVGRNALKDDALNTVGTVFAHKSTVVGGTPVAEDNLDGLLGCKSIEARVLSRDEILVSGEELKENSDIASHNEYKLYKNEASHNPVGLGFHPDEWEIPDGITNNSFPLPKSNRVLNSDNKYVRAVNPRQKRVRVPSDDGVAVGNRDDAAAFSASVSDAADLDAYASGVNTFNIEFPADAIGQGFEILAPSDGASDGDTGVSSEGLRPLAVISEDAAASHGDGPSTEGATDESATDDASVADDASVMGDAAVAGTVKQRAYTFVWDFTTPLVVRLHGADGTRSYRIDPAEVVRTAAVWGDTAYWIAEDGIRGLDDSLVEGEFVNLYNGRALSADGSVVDIAADVSNAPVTSLEGDAAVQSVAETSPVAAGEGWRTFWTYSEVDGGAERDMRLYPCGEDVYGVSSELDTVADGYVIADGDAFATAQDPDSDSAADGIDDGANAAGAAEADASADSSAVDASDGAAGADGASQGSASGSGSAEPAFGTHYRTVLMADGTLRDLADPLVYPDGFKNEGIASMTNTEAANVPLVVVRYDSGLMVCFDYTTGEVKFQKQGSGEDLSLFDYAARFFDGLLGGLFGSQEVPEGDSGYGDALALEDRASRGGLVGLDAGGSGSSGGSGTGSGDASAGVPGSSSGAGSAAGGFAAGTDYVSVYEPSNGGYVTYAVDDLLDGEAAGVSSVNETYDIPAAGGASVSVTTQAPAQLGAGALGQTGQVALFSSAILGILAILLFI